MRISPFHCSCFNFTIKEMFLVVAGKLLELAISIKGKLDKAYTDTMQKTISEARNLQRKMGDVNRAMQDQQKLAQRMGDLKGIQANIQRFRELKQSVASAGIEFSQAQAAASRYAAILRRSQAETARLKIEHDALKAALKASKGQIPKAEYERLSVVVKNTAAALKNSEVATKAAGRAFEQAKSHAAGLKTQLAGQQAELQRIRSGMTAAGYSAQNLAQNEIRLRQEIEQTRRAMQLANEEQGRRMARQENRTAHSQAQTDFFNATSTWQQGLFGVQTVASPLVGMIKTAAEFEAAMSKVKAITGATGGDFNKLTAKARELGETTQFSAKQAAEAMSYLGMAGWKTNEILAGMPGLLSLAAAGGTELARTADIISDDLTAFGLKADQAGHMADVFATTITTTNTNVEMLGETMKYAAPVAHGFGISMEDTAALAGLMANGAIKASQAGTSLRAGLLRLAGPPKKAASALAEMGMSLDTIYAEQREAAGALKALGIEMEDVKGPRKMSTILTELRQKTADLSEEQKLSTLGAIFGTNAASGWLNVVNAGPEAFDALVASLENCDGASDKIAQTMSNNAKGAATRLKSAMESLSISIGGTFLPMVAEAADWAAKWAGTLSQVAAAHPKLVWMLGILAAAIAAVIMTALTVNAAIAGWRLLATTYKMVMNHALFLAAKTKILTAAQMALNAVLARNPFALAVIAIAALVSALVYLYNTNETFLKMVVSAWETFSKAIGNGSGEAILAFAAIATQFYRLQGLQWTAIGNAAGNSFFILRGAVEASCEKMSGIAKAAKGTGAAVRSMAKDFTISGVINTVTIALKNMGSVLVGIGKTAMGAVFSPLGIAIMALAAAAYVLYQNWDAVGPYFMQLWNQICAAFLNAWTIIQPVFMQFMTSLQQFGAAISGQLTAAWQMLSQIIQNNSGAIAFLIGVLGTLASFIGGVVVAAILILANIFTSVVTTAISIAANAIATFLGVLQGIIDFITGIFMGNWLQAWNGVAQIFTSIFSGIGSFAQSILNGIGSTVSGVVSGIKAVMSFSGGGGASIPENAEGGIYRKGAFLTTFAEDSAEAAIPLDGSNRAVSLWQRAGEMLGLLPEKLSLPMKQGIHPPPIMNRVEALPPEINAIAEAAMPPTEADMAAAPVALEPQSGGDMYFEYHAPNIVINGNAGSGTVSQLEEALARAKADWMREVERKFGGMYNNMKHNERRTSFA